MKLSDLSDALRRWFELEPGYSVAGITREVVLTQEVSELVGDRIGNVYCFYWDLAPVAAQYSAISLFNPAANVGHQVEVLEGHFMPDTDGEFLYFGPGTSSTYDDRGAGYNLDQRGEAYRSIAHLATENSANPLLTAIGVIAPGGANVLRPFITRQVVPPGGLLTFRTKNVNSGLEGMLVWRETPVSQNP